MKPTKNPHPINTKWINEPQADNRLIPNSAIAGESISTEMDAAWLSQQLLASVSINGDEHQPTFIFAHGAGAPMSHAFMETMAHLLAEQGIKVVRFNFPYMLKRAQDGKRRPPDRAPALLAAFEQVILHCVDQPVVIGGKSMGGRMASLLADHPLVAGVACLGFPFHPPGKREKLKGDHLAKMDKPTLILQGERDTFGCREEVCSYDFSPEVTVAFLPDGDHSFKPRKASGTTEFANLQQASQRLAQFINHVYEGNNEK